jgi:hypothetical protein
LYLRRGYLMTPRSLLLGAAVVALSGISVLPGVAEAKGSVSAGPRAALRAPAIPYGPLRPRLPLTSTEVMPVGGGDEATLEPGGRPGVAVAAPASQTEAYGTRSERWPYSMARVAVVAAAASAAPEDVPVSSAPYAQTGKLFAQFNTGWSVCTASLIEPGVLVTAARCVHDFGQRNAGFADQVYWVPANTAAGSGGGSGPFGTYAAAQYYVPTPYWNGTDTCLTGARGVVCNNDIATVVLESNAGTALGGAYGYGWNGFSFVKSPAFGRHKVADITQLGYPQAFDGGWQMQRNNSFGKFIGRKGSNGKALKIVQIGSAMTDGSTGGPWLVNFGTKPSFDASKASLGAHRAANVVMGVTSWGYDTVGANVQGASWFGQNPEYPRSDYGGYGAGNIGSLMRDTCTDYPGAC